MKTRQETYSNYIENVKFTFSNGQVLDLLYKRDSDFADFLKERLNEYSRLYEQSTTEGDKKMFQYKKEAVLYILEALHTVL